MPFNRFERSIRRAAAREGKNPDRALAAAKAAVTRSARARGVDPARAWAGKAGAFARTSNRDVAARQHGQRSRERSETRLTPQQKRARTIAAQQLQTATAPAPAKRSTRSFSSLDDLYGYGDDYFFEDSETSPDYE